MVVGEKKHVSHASLLSIKIKRNIKSRKIDKRKRKILVLTHIITSIGVCKEDKGNV